MGKGGSGLEYKRVGREEKKGRGGGGGGGGGGGEVVAFNATFNNISVISWWSVLLVEEMGVPYLANI
jgi:hypothetical protein